jgi:membrane-associated phospholipid phosphatase
MQASNTLEAGGEDRTPLEPFEWRALVALLARPQPFTVEMAALFAIIPLYLVIGAWVQGGAVHAPEIALDRMIPVRPEWSVIYGSLFLAALLPAFVVHQQELLRRTILAYLAMWLFSYACFLSFPTIGPRPSEVTGNGFFAWVLRVIYSSDVRYNCLPSLHVAQCFLAALACHRVHRGVGAVALAWALAVGISTLYTKQHYVLDVIAGMALAFVAFRLFIRDYPRQGIPERERRFAPPLAMCAAGVYLLMVAGVWLIYAFA